MIKGEILVDRSLISLVGKDAKEFLQGLLTNDIKKLDAGNIIYSLMLTPQGKFLYDFFIFQENETLLIDCSDEDREEVISKLNLYKLGQDIAIQKNDRYQVIFLPVNIPGKSDPRFPLQASRMYVLSDNLEDTLKSYGIMLGEEYKAFLCSNIIPDASYDMIKTRSFPLEYGMDNYNAISYTKGCYVGQELIARTKYRGTIRKKLFKIEFSQNVSIEKGSEVVVDGKAVGIFCSAYKEIGKVLLREDVIKEWYPKAPRIEASIGDLKGQIIIFV